MEPKPKFEYRERGFWDLTNFPDHWTNEGIYLTVRECPDHGPSRVLGFPFDSRCGNIEICIECLQKVIVLANEKPANKYFFDVFK